MMERRPEDRRSRRSRRLLKEIVAAARRSARLFFAASSDRPNLRTRRPARCEAAYWRQLKTEKGLVSLGFSGRRLAMPAAQKFLGMRQISDNL